MINDIKPHKTQPKQVASHRLRPKRLAIFLLIVLLALAIGYGSIRWWSQRQHRNLDNVTTVVERVGRLFILPANEEPALFTVTDKTKVQTDFLKVSENGDKVLVYQKARRIIIYRPSVDKIVDVGPVSIAESR